MKRFGSTWLAPVLCVPGLILFLSPLRAADDNKTTAEDVVRHTRQTLQSVKNYTFQQKDEYQKKLESALKRLDGEMDRLKERAGQAKGEARQKYEREIQKLRAARQAAQKKLDRVKSATAASWEDVKSGVSKAFEDLQGAFDRMRAHFK